MNSIQIENISKSYGNIVALKDISINVHKGEIFGLIGADGAGKSTLFDILVTLLLPDKGKATIENLDVVKDYLKIRKLLGYMPGKFSLYQDLSVYENLDFFASIFGGTIEENYDLIKDIWVQIEPFQTRPAGKLSGGMKQKLALCCALVHKPTVLCLDEPTTGVDPVSRKEFWGMLKRLKEKEITILISTPYMDEAMLCDRVALIQQGTIMAIDTPLRITEKFGKKLFSIHSENLYRLLKDLRMYEETHSCYSFGQDVHLAVKSQATSKNDLAQYLFSKGHENVIVKIINAGIEDTFMELMNNSLKVES
ncbi:MAG: ABC transporter ATP-binding protein [Bacteroidota bacterium]|nr:ABC transporter ATP-binding protein [Bacteroidota bacterium]